MSGLLALVGGQEFTDGCTFDRDLLAASAGSEVLVLPTGAAYEHPERRYEAAEAWFTALGAKVRPLDVLTRPDALDPANAAVVRAATFIYLVGGSAMHLRSVLMHSPVWEALVAAWDDGAVVAGSVAGAQVLCDPMVDSRGGAFTLGLGLVNGITVIPQRNLWSEDALHRTRVLSNKALVLLGVDEATAAVRAPEGTWRAQGAGAVTCWIGGDTADLADVHC
jgi:cyanophycinase